MQLPKCCSPATRGAIMALAMLAVSPGGAYATWSAQTTANPSSATTSVLRGVSCETSAGSDFCMAVGDSVSSIGIELPLAEKLSGSTWSLSTLVDPATGSQEKLGAVSCPTTWFCMAAGWYVTGGHREALAEMWESGTWKLQTLPLPSGTTSAELVGVSCESADECVADGDYHNSTGEHFFIEQWVVTSGGIWEALTPSDAGLEYPGLRAISCTRVERCVAVGVYKEESGFHYHEVPVSDVWEGSSGWKVYKMKNPAGDTEFLTNDVSCTEPDACLAVGSYETTSAPTGRALAESWNGSGWTWQEPKNAGNPNDLYGISCVTSIEKCVAVGETIESGVTENLGEELSGASWKLLSIPNGSASGSQLGRVSCIELADCYAVGSYVKGTETLTLAEHN
jgi:hypothetical protein